MALLSFRPPSRVLVEYHMEMAWIPLSNAVWVNCKMASTTENQGAGDWYIIWAKWCVFDDGVSVIGLDITTLP